MRKFDKKDHVNEGTETGDLFVTFEIEFPKSLSDDQRKRIETILS